MSDSFNDPMGQAILDFAKTHKNKDITVVSEICDDDIIPSAYLFRSYDEMPEIEKTALSLCSGKILEVGAGSGMHANYLMDKGLDVKCIDISPGAIEHLQSTGINAELKNFFDPEDEKYDTILMLMNGIGIAGNLSNLERTLQKGKSLLTKKGKIICDSADIKYLYEDDEGGMWIDLTTEYYGNFKFQMKYDKHVSEWFEWLYVDFENLKSVAEKLGFEVEKVYDDNDQYLVQLTAH